MPRWIWRWLHGWVDRRLQRATVRLQARRRYQQGFAGYQAKWNAAHPREKR